MKEHYDFSKGEKAKFFVPEDEIELPIYLSSENRKYYLDLAANKNLDLSLLINKILSKDKDLADLLL